MRRLVVAFVAVIASLMIATALSPSPAHAVGLRWTRTPAQGPTGTVIAVRSVDPCPDGPRGEQAETVLVSFTEDPAGSDAIVSHVEEFPVRADGHWSGTITATGRTGPDAQVDAACRVQGGRYEPQPFTVTTAGQGYLVARQDGEVISYGDAGAGTICSLCPERTRPISAFPIVDLAIMPATGAGWWEVATDGGVFTGGGASFFGSLGGVRLNAPVSGVTPTPSGRGYWLAAEDGGVFTFGDAGFFGSAGSMRLNRRVVGIAPTPSGRGYWLVAEDGGVFTFGDAPFGGSAATLRLVAPVVDMARTPTGRGYWMAARDGGVFTFGDAGFFGSAGGLTLAAPVSDISATRADGYRLLGEDGGIFTYGAATFHGASRDFFHALPAVGLAGTP